MKTISLNLDREARDMRRAIDNAKAVVLAGTISPDFDPIQGLIQAAEVSATCTLILDGLGGNLDASDQDRFNTLLGEAEDVLAEFKARYKISLISASPVEGHVVQDDATPARRVRHIKPTDTFAAKAHIVRPDGSVDRALNPDNRAKTFGVQLPFDVQFEHLIKSNRYSALELELHEQFASKRVKGEWFALAPEDVAVIKGIPND